MADRRWRNVSKRTWVVIGVGVVAAAGALVWALAGQGETAPEDPRASAGAEDGCGGVEVQRIELNAQVIEPTDTFCFVVEDESDVTVGAAALDPAQSLVLEVSDAEGELLGRATSAEGIDPQVIRRLAPGTYTGHVSTPGLPEAAPFLVYTAAFPPASDVTPDLPDLDLELPSVEDCGVSVPLVAHGERLPGSSSAPVICIEVSDISFVKVGAQSADPDANPDLQIAVYRDNGGELTLMRTNDDAFGLDPELSFDAAPGTYVVATYAWFGEPTGDFTWYVDTEGTLWREDYESARFGSVTPAMCDADGALRVTPGETRDVPAGQAVVCLDIAATGRYTLTVTSAAGDSIAMEVLRPSATGAPVRLAYTDLNPYATDTTVPNILLDMTFPEGTLAVGVFSWFSDAAPGAYTVSLEPSAPR